MEHMDIEQFNCWAKNNIVDENRFDDNGYIIMENNEDFKSQKIIPMIFIDHWTRYYSKYQITLDKLRPSFFLLKT